MLFFYHLYSCGQIDASNRRLYIRLKCTPLIWRQCHAVCSPFEGNFLDQNDCLCVMIHFFLEFPRLPDIKQIGTQSQHPATMEANKHTGSTELDLDSTLHKASSSFEKVQWQEPCLTRVHLSVACEEWRQLRRISRQMPHELVYN